MRNWIIIIGCLWIACFSCALPNPVNTDELSNKNPNVLLIMVDDLNDHIIGLNGHPQAHTPQMNRLAKSGASFLRAYTLSLIHI